MNTPTVLLLRLGSPSPILVPPCHLLSALDFLSPAFQELAVSLDSRGLYFWSLLRHFLFFTSTNSFSICRGNHIERNYLHTKSTIELPRIAYLFTPCQKCHSLILQNKSPLLRDKKERGNIERTRERDIRRERARVGGERRKKDRERERTMQGHHIQIIVSPFFSVFILNVPRSVFISTDLLSFLFLCFNTWRNQQGVMH